MPQDFLDLQRDEPLLLPAGMREWLPEDDLTFAVLDAVTLGVARSAVGTGQLRCARRWPRRGTGTEARLH